jgi:glycylpeptide N-tetradecanoyltransferase
MCPPGWKKLWHIGKNNRGCLSRFRFLIAIFVGVMRSKNKQMVGFITGVPCMTRVYEKSVKMVEINFLCVHKLYRDKRIAPVLIKVKCICFRFEMHLF